MEPFNIRYFYYLLSVLILVSVLSITTYRPTEESKEKPNRELRSLRMHQLLLFVSCDCCKGASPNNLQEGESHEVLKMSSNYPSHSCMHVHYSGIGSRGLGSSKSQA